MSDLDSFISKLIELKATLSKDVEQNSESANFINVSINSLPVDIFNLLQNKKLINSEFNFVFLGHHVFSMSEVAYHFQNKNEKMSFFGAYEYSEKFILTDKMKIMREDTLEEILPESSAINYIGNIVPLMSFQ